MTGWLAGCEGGDEAGVEGRRPGQMGRDMGLRGLRACERNIAPCQLSNRTHNDPHTPGISRRRPSNADKRMV